MKCDICGEVNDAVEIHMCKQCANKFNDNVNRIKRDLAIYKRALELASKPRNDWGCTDREYNNYKYGTYYDYYLDQAKKELEEQDAQD